VCGEADKPKCKNSCKAAIIYTHLVIKWGRRPNKVGQKGVNPHQSGTAMKALLAQAGVTTRRVKEPPLQTHPALCVSQQPSHPGGATVTQRAALLRHTVHRRGRPPPQGPAQSRPPRHPANLTPFHFTAMGLRLRFSEREVRVPRFPPG